MTSGVEFPILPFENQKSWELWLEKNHERVTGVWIQFFKKNSGVPTVTYAEAVEVALCYGWIDSQAKSLDDTSYLQKFTPRGSKSIWSKVNTEHIVRLSKLGKMKPAGLKAVETAKANGRWEQAYDSPSTMTLPPEFLKQLEINKKAKSFFETLTKANKYAIAWRLQTAKKPETKERRMKLFLEMLEKGEKLHD